MENLLKLNEQIVSRNSDSLSGGKVPEFFKNALSSLVGKKIDLTNKTSGSEKIVKVISDYEGEKLPDVKEGDHCIICGDILDSTGGGTLDYATGKIGNYSRNYNLRNIIKIVSEPDKYTLIYGNRDINKFKTGPLTMLEYVCNRLGTSPDAPVKNVVEANDAVFNFNFGTVPISELKKLYDILKELSSKQCIKWKASTKHWLPFWNNKLTNTLYETQAGTQAEKTAIYWAEDDTKLTETPFLSRFNKIFGVDGAVGSMSAQNLLYTIPLELIELGYFDTNLNLKKQLEQYLIDKKQGVSVSQTEISDDFLAFITLLVFRTMCVDPTIKTSSTETSPDTIFSDKNLMSGDNTKNKKINLKGLLHKFYNCPNAIFVGYMNFKNQLILFSHGGITSEVMSEYECQIAVLRAHIENNSAKLSQRGGAKTYTSTSIIKTLETVQSKMDKLMQDVMKQKEFIPTPEMLFIMALSAPFKPKSLPEQFVTMSPINPGIDVVLSNKFYCSDKKLVQIFGHVPKGFGTGLYKFNQDQHELNIVNVDISQSYKYGGNAGHTNNKLVISKDGNINVETMIDVTDDKITIVTDTEFKDNTIYTNGTQTKEAIKGAIMIKNDLETLLKGFKEQKEDGYTFIYHGRNSTYTVYSKLKDREKQLYLLAEQQSTRGALAKANPVATRGGNYKEKYLKYKQKYLQLKNNSKF